MTTEEMLLQLIEGQKQMSKDISDIKEDIAEIKEEAIITRTALNRQGDMLDQLVDFVNDFNPQKVDSFSVEDVKKAFKVWLSNGVSRYNFKYVAIPEYHKSGRIHVHALMSGDLKLMPQFMACL